MSSAKSTKRSASAHEAEADSVPSQPRLGPTDLPVAQVRAGQVTSDAKWLKRVLFVVAALIGWLFVAWIYRFALSAPMVMLCIGWLAVISAVVFLYQGGAALGVTDNASDPWWKPIGDREELLLQKRSLLKAIKEVEFDHEMGKQSDAEAKEIIGVYRARAIEVIKALEVLDRDPSSVSVRDQIELEVKAQLAVAAAAAKGSAKSKSKDKAKSQPAQASASKATEPSKDASKVAEPADESTESAAPSVAHVSAADEQGVESPS